MTTTAKEITVITLSPRQQKCPAYVVDMALGWVMQDAPDGRAEPAAPVRVELDVMQPVQS